MSHAVLTINLIPGKKESSNVAQKKHKTSERTKTILSSDKAHFVNVLLFYLKKCLLDILLSRPI